MTPISLFARNEQIIRAYEEALDGRDAADVSVFDLAPHIFASVPGVTIKEIVDALRWSARQCEREADALERFGMQKFGTGDGGGAP